MVEFMADSGTLVPSNNESAENTMIAHSDSNTLVANSDIESDLGTLVINSDGEDDDSTMKSEFLMFFCYCFMPPPNCAFKSTCLSFLISHMAIK